MLQLCPTELRSIQNAGKKKKFKVEGSFGGADKFCQVLGGTCRWSLEGEQRRSLILRALVRFSGIFSPFFIEILFSSVNPKDSFPFYLYPLFHELLWWTHVTEIRRCLDNWYYPGCTAGITSQESFVSTHRNWLLRLKEFSSEKPFVRNPSVFQYLTIMFFGNCRQNSNALFDVKTKISKIWPAKVYRVVNGIPICEWVTHPVNRPELARARNQIGVVIAHKTMERLCYSCY